MVKPGHNIPYTVPVMDDTGSDVMVIFQADLTAMNLLSGTAGPPILGWQNFSTASGTLSAPIVEITLSIPDPKQSNQYLMPFINVFCGLKPGGYRTTGNGERLSGRWMRDVLYSATSPDGNRELYITARKSDLKGVPASRAQTMHRWKLDRSYLNTLSPNPPSGQGP